jgi:hypothetical protein
MMTVIGQSFLVMSLAMLSIYCHSSAWQEKTIRTHGTEDDSLTRLVSPHQIARYINEHNDEANLNDLWAKFGVETEFGKPGKCGCRGFDCPGQCRAEVIQTDPDKEHDELLILRVSYAGDAYCWFLVFEKKSDWRVVGVVESLENQYKPPEHRIVKHGRQRWLVITELCGRGTGFVNYVERWHQLTGVVPKEVLSYGVSGHSVQGETSDYEFISRVFEQEDEGKYRIEIKYVLLREPVTRPEFRWTSTHRYRASFVWDSVAEQFVLDSARSSLPESEESPIIRNIDRRYRK